MCFLAGGVIVVDSREKRGAAAFLSHCSLFSSHVSSLRTE